MQLVKLELLGDARCSEGGQYASHEDTRNTPGGQILHGGFSRVRLCQAACAVSQLGAGGTASLGCNEERLVGRTFSSLTLSNLVTLDTVSRLQSRGPMMYAARRLLLQRQRRPSPGEVMRRWLNLFARFWGAPLADLETRGEVSVLECSRSVL